MIDSASFDSAKLNAILDSEAARGVGTLSEKYVHRILKYTIDPSPDHHEVKHLGCIADVKNEDGITEIQTRSFEKLLPKLQRFLPQDKVTLVCPLAYKKRLCIIDGESGETTYRKSPVSRGICYAASELYKIRAFLGDKNLCVLLLLLEVDEYVRELYPGAKRPKRVKLNALPTAIIGRIALQERTDYRILIPDDLPPEFLAKDFARKARLKGRRAYYALKLCEYLGFVSVVGKRGKAFVYRKSNTEK